MGVKIAVNSDDEPWRARGIGEDIFKQGQTADELYANLKEAVALHFENGKPSKKMKKYLIAIERTESGYSNYSPDLTRCVSTGKTREETESNMREAIEFHVDGFEQAGFPVPEPPACSPCMELPA